MPVATIIHAVSAPSIFGVCARAGETVAQSASAVPTTRRHARPLMPYPPGCGCCGRCAAPRLKRVAVGLAGADAHRMIEGGDEDLAVTDLPGARRRAQRFDHPVSLLGGHRHLDADFRQEAHHIFGATIDLGMALLAAIAFDLRDGHAVDAEAVERLAHVVEFEWLDDRNNELHGRLPQIHAERAGRKSSRPRTFDRSAARRPATPGAWITGFPR